MSGRHKTPPHPPLSDAWKADLDRHGAEIDSGDVKLIEHHEVMARVRERLRAADMRFDAVHLPNED